MRTKTMTTIMLTFFLVSIAFVAPVAATPDNGIVGEWHFDEGTGSTAYDSSTYGNDGTLSGGKFGNALEFDGYDDGVFVSDSSSLDFSEAITIEAWIYLHAYTNLRGHPVQTVAEKAHAYYLNIQSGKLSFYWYGLSIPGYHQSLTTLPLNKWIHVAATYDGSAVKLYENGAEVRSILVTGEGQESNWHLGIGYEPYYPDKFPRYFDGTIDEVRISKIARTDFALIAQALPDGDTVGLWHFDESVGDVGYDSSGNENHGTIYGAKWAGPTWATEGLQFDGVDDYVDVSHSPSLDITGEITIEARVYAEGTGTMLKIACKRETQVPFYFIGVDQGKLYAGIGDATSYVVTDKVTALPLNEWHYVAMSYSDDDDKIWLYLDGELKETVTCTVSLVSFESNLLIGAQLYNGKYMQFFKGIIDEIQISNTALRLAAQIDINPDTLNLKSNGQWITAFITLPEGYSVEDIDPDTVKLEKVALAWSEIQDGVFMAKFDRGEVQGAINDVDGSEPDTKFREVTLIVRGEFSNGQPFEGSDTVRVITK